MTILADFALAVVALLHVGFLVLEMFCGPGRLATASSAFRPR